MSRTVRPFADLRREHRKGDLHAELGERLNELVEAVQTTGKGGALALVINVKPAAKNSAEMVVE
jgi:hypothetical protein